MITMQHIALILEHRSLLSLMFQSHGLAERAYYAHAQFDMACYFGFGAPRPGVVVPLI